jgi:hypothetical protein
MSFTMARFLPCRTSSILSYEQWCFPTYQSWRIICLVRDCTRYYDLRLKFDGISNPLYVCWNRNELYRWLGN